MSGSTSSGQIDFNIYPAATNRVPGVFAEVDNSQANTGQINQRGLIIGQMFTSGPNAGTATPALPTLTAGQTDAQARFGKGSMVERMLSRIRAIDSFGETWALPLADDTAAAVATGGFVFTGPATAAGTLSAYIAGQLVPVGVSAGDTNDIMGANMAAVIATMPELPVAASYSNTTHSLTLTSKHKGLSQNDIDLRFNYQGAAGGEFFPAGVGVTITAMTGGTQNPTTLASALSTLGQTTFDFIFFPYTDTSSLNAMQLFLNDQVGRWSPLQELFGGFFGAYRGTYSQRGTFGNARNDQHGTIMGFYDSPSPVWDWTADVGAACAVSLRADPGVPLQTLALNVLAPPIASRDLFTTQNTLLYDGISTFTVDDSNTVRIQRMVTTYQENPAGAPDDSYLDVETMYSLQFLIRDMRVYLQSQFPRAKLVIDGTRIAPGSNMVTSQTVLASAIARYRYQCVIGNAQDPDGFSKAAVGQNQGNGLVALLLPFRLVNQLRVIAMKISFIKP